MYGPVQENETLVTSSLMYGTTLKLELDILGLRISSVMFSANVANPENTHEIKDTGRAQKGIG
jgi:hypothetical protein